MLELAFIEHQAGEIQSGCVVGAEAQDFCSHFQTTLWEQKPRI